MGRVLDTTYSVGTQSLMQDQRVILPRLNVGVVRRPLFRIGDDEWTSRFWITVLVEYVCAPFLSGATFMFSIYTM